MIKDKTALALPSTCKQIKAEASQSLYEHLNVRLEFADDRTLSSKPWWIDTDILRYSRDLEIFVLIYHREGCRSPRTIVDLLRGWIGEAGGALRATKLHIEVQVASWPAMKDVFRKQCRLNDVFRVLSALQCPKAQGNVTGRFWSGEMDLSCSVLDEVLAKLHQRVSACSVDVRHMHSRR